MMLVSYGIEFKYDYRSDMYDRIETYRSSGQDIWSRMIMTFDSENGSVDGSTMDRLIKTFLLWQNSSSYSLPAAHKM